MKFPAAKFNVAKKIAAKISCGTHRATKISGVGIQLNFPATKFPTAKFPVAKFNTTKISQGEIFCGKISLSEIERGETYCISC